MSNDKLTLEELEKRIAERKKLIKRFVDFAEKLVCKSGEVLDREVGSSNTHTVACLRDFGSFSFLADTGQTMMGGNTIEIWYHPGISKISFNATKPVLIVWYQCNLDEAHAEIRVFDTNVVWQTALKWLISRKDKVLIEVAKKKQAHEAKSRTDEANKIRRAELEKEARRLRL